ncbi:carboxyltransferase domain-containing protein [Rhodococcus hoagii]|nr:carboxyltransferase domain-containing protein [Prescottella equi]
MLPQYRLLGVLQELESRLPATHDLVVPSRTVRLPLSFDDPSIAEAMARYRSGVRDTAPWLPSNTEFIRRINGLGSVDDVRKAVFDAEYLVLGLGDVYLGAPLAVPLDPRHRLVTTKYNPARTWTPSDAVGIGGKYLCVYGMESPGGYQLIGRTVPIWSGYGSGHRSSPASRGCSASSTDRVGARHPRTARAGSVRFPRRAIRRRRQRGHVRTGRPPALPRGTRRIDRRVRGTAGGGVRGREAGVARGRRVRPRRRRAGPRARDRGAGRPTGRRRGGGPDGRQRVAGGTRTGTAGIRGRSGGGPRSHETRDAGPVSVAGTVLQVLAEPAPRWRPGLRWPSSAELLLGEHLHDPLGDLPPGAKGSSSTVTTCSGVYSRVTPCAASHEDRSSAVSSVPSAVTTTAHTFSPNRASCTPTTATIVTAGWARTNSSTSTAEMFLPPRMMMSALRPTTRRRPAASISTMSPSSIQPSSVYSSALAASSSQ